jgi:hypothetical protein
VLFRSLIECPDDVFGGFAYDGQNFTAPPIPEALPQPFDLYKTTIYERMTDAELETFDASMRAAPLRDRLMWSDCVTVNSYSPYFAALSAAMLAAFGAERTAAILARP